MNTKDILAKLEKVMESQNITKYGLAKISDICYNTIYDWYNKGADPSFSNILRVVQALNIDFSALLNEEDKDCRELIDSNFLRNYAKLSDDQKAVVGAVVKEFLKSNGD